MAATMNLEMVPVPEQDTDAGAEGLFHRRIEFHVARKQFSGFGSSSSTGFKLVTLNPISETHKESGSAQTGEKPEISEMGLDPELSFKITFRRIGAGLRNLGNTCFLNSVLQCLTYTEPLAAYLQNGKHQYSCRTAGFCALCAIQKHVSRALQSSGRILEPKDLVSNLRCISRSFRNARQEDAHEYMVNLLESMHKCCLPSGVPSESPGAYEKSLVHKIFGGRLRSQVKCMQCSFCSNKFDPFLDLSLEIVKADSLYKALAHFTDKEQLDGGAKQYQCQQCNQKVKALKQLTIYKAPHVLTIHLKRFGSHVSGQKIDKKIAFCPTLDLAPFVTGPCDGDLKYTLYGVLVHAGWSTHSGHYYCFVRTSSGMWYSLDDNQVVQVNERKVLEQKAYMLFYVRDRKDLTAKKENMVMNAIRNGTYPKFNLETKEKMQNGSVEDRANCSFSAALSDRDKAMGSGSPKTFFNNIPSQKPNANTDGGCLATDRASQSTPSMMKPADPVKNCSTAAPYSICHQTNSHSTVIVSVDTTLTTGRTITGNNASQEASPHSVGGLDSVHVTDPSAVAMPSSFNKDSAGKNQNELACESQDMIASCVPSGKMCPIDGTSSEMVGYSKSISSETLETQENNQSMTDLQVKLLSGVPPTVVRLSRGIAKRKRPQLKARRKLFKLPVANMALSSNIIFGGVITLKKKKKLRSQHSLQITSSDRKHLLKGTVSSSSFQSSASYEALSVPSKRKILNDDACGKDKSSSINKGNGICATDFIKDGPHKKVERTGTKLSYEGQLHNKKFVTGVPVSSVNHESKLSQNGKMGVSIGGLAETNVARWDSSDVPVAEKTEANVADNTQIGYIGDEWDEEYDRGKRKKIRGPKTVFGGPNLFQEFAARNAKIKKAKLNRSRSENQPYRI